MTFEKILIVEDDLSIRKLLETHLRRQRYLVTSAATLCEAESVTQEETFDLLFLDIFLPDGNGLEFLKRLMQTPKPPMTLVMSGYSGMDAAICSLRAGAFDSIVKPFSLEEIDISIERAATFRHVMEINRHLESEIHRHEEILGDSVAAKWLRAMVRKVAPTEVSLLITGERGVGKGRLAEVIHASSRRSSGPLIRVNCAVEPPERSEGVLFGRDQDWSEGRVELASGGTLVLEEIGHLPPLAQARLLGVLETQEFERPGSCKPVKVDVRVIATATRSLEEPVAQGKFDRSLFARLNMFPLRVPALKERMEDMPILVEEWLSRPSPCSWPKPTGISEEALQYLKAFPWPGNLPELENALARAAILAGGRRIEAMDFGFLAIGSSGPLALPVIPVKNSASEPIVTLDELEKRHVLRALEFTNQNRTRAADLLKISVRTLRNKLHIYRAEKSMDIG